MSADRQHRAEVRVTHEGTVALFDQTKAEALDLLREARIYFVVTVGDEDVATFGASHPRASMRQFMYMADEMAEHGPEFVEGLAEIVTRMFEDEEE